MLICDHYSIPFEWLNPIHTSEVSNLSRRDWLIQGLDISFLYSTTSTWSTIDNVWKRPCQPRVYSMYMKKSLSFCIETAKRTVFQPSIFARLKRNSWMTEMDLRIFCWGHVEADKTFCRGRDCVWWGLRVARLGAIEPTWHNFAFLWSVRLCDLIWTNTDIIQYQHYISSWRGRRNFIGSSEIVVGNSRCHTSVNTSAVNHATQNILWFWAHVASSSKLSTRSSISSLATMSNVINGWFQLLTDSQLIILSHFDSHLKLYSPINLPELPSSKPP